MRALILTSSVLLALALAAPAAAHYENDGRWAFGSVTRNDDGDPVDPINLFIYPYGMTYDPYSQEQDRIEAHFAAHWKGVSQWTKDADMSNPGVFRFRHCKISQGLRWARSFDPGYEQMTNDFQGAGHRRVLGPWDDCRNRYHYRLWRDYHAHTPYRDVHTERNSWAIGGIHYDKLKPRLGASCDRTACVVFPERLSHFTGQDWDTVEWVTAQKMNKQRDSGQHRDHENRKGGHCYKTRWKVLPGSEGPFGNPTKISDGRPARISMSHCPR